MTIWGPRRPYISTEQNQPRAEQNGPGTHSIIINTFVTQHVHPLMLIARTQSFRDTGTNKATYIIC